LNAWPFLGRLLMEIISTRPTEMSPRPPIIPQETVIWTDLPMDMIHPSFRRTNRLSRMEIDMEDIFGLMAIGRFCMLGRTESRSSHYGCV
jgi:hypothetical protein